MARRRRVVAARAWEETGAGLTRILKALACAIAGAFAASTSAAAGQIYLYEKPGPDGQSLKIEADTPDLSAVPHAFQIKALKVMRGGWLLCSQPGYQGDCLWVIGRFVRNLTTTPFQYDVRSLKTGGVVRSYPWPPTVVASIVVAAPLEDGRLAPINEDVPDLATAGIDFPVRSVKLRFSGSTAWQLCTEPNYGGRCILMFDGIDELRAIFPETIASLRRVQAVSSAAGNSRGF